MRRSLGLLAAILLLLCAAFTARANYGLRVVGRAVPGEATSSFIVSNRCYLGAGDCLQVYDTTNPAAPLILGQLQLPGLVEDVVVAGPLAYVADGVGGLIIVDITFVSHMAVLGQLTFPDEAFGICVQGTTAYVAAVTAGFFTVDVSNPSAPVQRGSFPVEWSALNIAVQGNVAYVASAYGGLYLLDVSNPDAPALLGLLDSQGTWAYDVKVDGIYAYMAYSSEGGGGGLAVVNVSNPAVPQTIGDGWMSWALRRMDYSAGYVYGAAVEGGLVVYDVHTPAWPHVVGQISGKYGNNISYAVGRAYLCGGKDGLCLFNVTIPSSPTLLGSLATYSASQDVAVSGTWAYVVDQPAGLHAVNLANPAAPQVTFTSQFCFQNGAYRGVSSGVSIADGRLYVSDFADMEGGQHDFRAYGLTNPATPQLLGTFTALEAGVRGHRVRNNIAYLANSWQLRVLNVTNPASMTVAYDLAGGWDFAYGMDLVGDYIYLGTMLTGLRVLSLADPLHPAVVGSFDTPGQAFTAKYQAGYAYVPDYDQGLRIVNVQDLANPYEVGSFFSTVSCLDVAFVQSAVGPAAVVVFDDGIVVLDVSNPANPIEIGSYTTGDPRRLCVVGNTIYVADRNTGLWMLVLDGPTSSVDGSITGHQNALASLRSYPNPTRGATTLEFELPAGGPVAVDVYDLGGRKVAAAFSGTLAAGMNRIAWNGRDSGGREVSAGVYLYRVTADGKATTGSVTVLR